MIAIPKNLGGVNENGSLISRGVIYTTETKPYVEGIQHNLEYCIPTHGQCYRTLEFTFDPRGFVCDPSEIIARAFDQGFGGDGGGRL